MLFVPLGPSCPLQTILLSNLVGHDSPLQIIMAVWQTFFKFEARLNSHYCLRQTVITIYRGLPDWMGSIAYRFAVLISRAEKPSEDINSRFFLMNEKALKVVQLR